MNGFPTFNPPAACAFCGQPFPLSKNGAYVAAWRSSTAKLYCSEFCADDEEEANFRRRRA
jgi:hypothetical protein